jgi:hypothetical protein
VVIHKQQTMKIKRFHSSSRISSIWHEGFFFLDFSFFQIFLKYVFKVGTTCY